MLLTTELRKMLPELYANEHLAPDDVKVICKFFNPFGNHAWYITEFDGEDIFFGFCNLGDDLNAELGYVSLGEIESVRLPYGMKIERDLHWDENTTLEAVINFKAR